MNEQVAELQRERLTLAATHSKLVRQCEQVVARLTQVEAMLDGIEAGQRFAAQPTPEDAPS